MSSEIRSIWKCSRFTWRLILPAAAISLILGVFLLAAFGNPQWDWRIYCFHEWIWSRVRIPVDYTGVWRSWDGSGTLRCEETYEDGRPHGRWKRWDCTGELVAEGLYFRGFPWEGEYEMIDGNTMRAGKVFYLAGKKVTEAEYRSVDGKSNTPFPPDPPPFEVERHGRGYTIKYPVKIPEEPTQPEQQALNRPKESGQSKTEPKTNTKTEPKDDAK